MNESDELLRSLQARAAWGAHTYTEQFNADPRPHRDFAHAVIHIVKAAGKLARWDLGLVDEDAPKACADVAICIARAANTVPGGPVDIVDTVRSLGHRSRAVPGAVHCVIGALMEAAGSLAALVDAMDHGEAWDLGFVKRALACAWIDTTRLAEMIPQPPLELSDVIEKRLAEKGIGAKPSDARAYVGEPVWGDIPPEARRVVTVVANTGVREVVYNPTGNPKLWVLFDADDPRSMKDADAAIGLSPEGWRVGFGKSIPGHVVLGEGARRFVFSNGYPFEPSRNPHMMKLADEAAHAAGVAPGVVGRIVKPR